MTDLESAVDQLQAVPLEDFVGERKRLAKELRGAGEREAAAELAKLPKPSAPAWSLNHIAREQPEPVGAWLDATDALREASSSADLSSGATLRAAMTAHREATRRLLATVRESAHPNGRALTEPMLDRVRDLLRAATADPARAEQLRAGRVVERDDDAAEEPAVISRDAKSGGAATKRGAKPGPAAKRPDGGRDSKRTLQERAAAERAEREAEQRAELERLAGAAEARLAELRETASVTAAAATQADERLEQAQQTLRRSESEADAARQAAAEAAEAAAQAERELQKLAAKLAP